MKSFRIIKNAVLALGVFSFLGFAKPAFADEPPVTGIQVSPTSQRITLDPGAHYSGHISVTNTGTHTLSFRLSVAPYQVDENYNSVFNVSNARTQISNWVTFPEQEGSVEPNQVTIVDYDIDVPMDAPGGGQYAAIFVGTDDATGNEQSVRVNAATGMVIIARVNGETRESGSIVSTNIPSFLLNPPVTASVTVNNDGNVDEEIRNGLKIENYFSGAVIYENDGSDSINTILPNTTRTIVLSHSNVPRLGVLKITLTTEYMNDAQIKTATVFICPLWFIAIILLIILTIVARIIAKRRDDRRTRANSRNSQGSAEKFNI